MGESSASAQGRLGSWLRTCGALLLGVTSLACDVDPELPDAAMVDPPGALCPEIEPLTGPYAMKGDCCYRASNQEKLKQNPEGAELEFRIMASQVVTQPLTIGSIAFLDYVQRGYDFNRSVSLIRIRQFPAEPPGNVVIETGPGRFNENGTYSFLKDAAPITDTHDDPSRWDSITANAYYDPDAPEGQRFVPTDPDVVRQLVLTPEWLPDGRLDYELPQYSPRVLSMTLSDDLNCIGERGDETRWLSHDEIESFVPVEEASREISSTGWSLCTSLAFGYRLNAGTCELTTRPFWAEQPTAMCVDGICYDGTPRPDNAQCRLDPTNTSDPRPLCCDPIALDVGLPACNAFHVRARYVAAAVEITDDPVNDGSPLLPN